MVPCWRWLLFCMSRLFSEVWHSIWLGSILTRAAPPFGPDYSKHSRKHRLWVQEQTGKVCVCVYVCVCVCAHHIFSSQVSLVVMTLDQREQPLVFQTSVYELRQDLLLIEFRRSKLSSQVTQGVDWVARTIGSDIVMTEIWMFKCL